MAKLSAMVESLGKKCEELEARSRWHNIRLVGLPEGSEGPQPTESIAKLLMDLLGLDEMPGLDRAHRTLRAKPKEGEPSRPMVIRVTQFQVRNAILRHAGRSAPLLHNGKRVHIFPDFTPTVAKRRAAFAQVKRELHACANVKFGLRYPATSPCLAARPTDLKTRTRLWSSSTRALRRIRPWRVTNFGLHMCFLTRFVFLRR